MKKFLVFLFNLLLVFGVAGICSATVTGLGTFDIFFPEGVSYSIQYNYGDGYFGSISEYNMITHTYAYSKIFYLDNGSPVRQGYGEHNDSSISGSHNTSTGDETFAFSAVSPEPGVTESRSDIDLYASALFTGTLSGDFGYNYSFSGQKDDTDDRLSFMIQMESSYYDPD